MQDDGGASGSDDSAIAHVSGRRSTESVTNLQYQFLVENNRQYHAYCQDLQYFMPNDKREQDRLDLFHFICLSVMDHRLHHPGLHNPRNILDVGTGTGAWAIDIADLFPSAEVVGVDLSPIQPVWVPPNLQFEVADATDLTLFGHSTFDYIHVRCFAGCVSDWVNFLETAFHLLRPGGSIECTEVEIGIRYEQDDVHGVIENTYLNQYLRLIHEASESRHKPLNVASRLKDHLQTAGFRDVRETIYTIPLHAESADPAQSEIGRAGLRWALESIEAYGLRLLTRESDWSDREAIVLFARAKNDLRSAENQALRPYTRLFTVHAEKPGEPATT